MHIISYADASALGLKFYFTGNPCANGHASERRTSNGHCVACEARRRKTVSIKRAAAREADIARRVATAIVSNIPPSVMTRASAKASGSQHYFSGNPCKQGHLAMRRTVNGACVVCAKAVVNTDSAKSRRKVLHRERYLELRDELLAYGKEYREKNRAKFTAWMAEWRQKNPERARELRRASEAKRRAKGGGMPSGEMRDWVRAQAKVCHWCGAKCPKKYHVDHYEPLSKGGKHAVANLVIACPKCNLKKSAKDPYEFAATVGRLF